MAEEEDLLLRCVVGDIRGAEVVRSRLVVHHPDGEADRTRAVDCEDLLHADGRRVVRRTEDMRGPRQGTGNAVIDSVEEPRPSIPDPCSLIREGMFSVKYN